MEAVHSLFLIHILYWQMAVLHFGKLNNNNLDYNLEEYGVLYSETVSEPVISDTVNCQKLPADQLHAPANAKGQYGLN